MLNVKAFLGTISYMQQVILLPDDTFYESNI